MGCCPSKHGETAEDAAHPRPAEQGTVDSQPATSPVPVPVESSGPNPQQTGVAQSASPENIPVQTGDNNNSYPVAATGPVSAPQQQPTQVSADPTIKDFAQDTSEK